MVKYRVRWRFDFLDGTNAIGMWSLSTKNPVDQAWNKNKGGLLRASIEGKTAEGEIITLAEVDGHDFCLFKWIAFATVPGGASGNITPIHALGGLQIVTGSHNIFALQNGRVWVEECTADDKKIHMTLGG